MTDANWNADLDFDDVVRATMTDADKLVEEIARAIYWTRPKEHDWDHVNAWIKDAFRDEARAALALAVERCAEVAENFSSEGDMAEHLARVGITARIRSLSPNAKGETHE